MNWWGGAGTVFGIRGCGRFLQGLIAVSGIALMSGQGRISPACEVLHPGDVVVNEILFDRSDPPLEFVELFNRSSCTVEVAGLTLSDSRGTREPISSAMQLLPGEYAALVSDESAFSLLFQNASPIPLSRWPALNNGGDAVVIRYGDAILDSVFYEASWGVSNRSIERRNPHLPGIAPANWGASTDPAGGTPGRQNSLFATDSDPPYVVYAEEEPGHAIYIRLSEPMSPERMIAASFRAGQHPPSRVDEGLTALEFRLLFDAEIKATELYVNGLVDLAGNLSPPQTIPIAGIARAGELLLNEILFDPHADANDGLVDQPEYVEIVSRASRLLSVRGLALAEDETDDGVRPKTVLTDHRLSVDPGGYVVAYESGEAAFAGSAPPPEFASFGTDAGADALWLPVGSVTPRGLANAGQDLVLESTSGEAVDFVRYASDWHSATLRELGELRGTSLERRSLLTGSTDAVNWTSSVVGTGGTPGRLNSVNASVASGGNPDPEHGILVAPSPFSPDDDGRDDVALIDYRIRNQVAFIRIHVFDLNGRIVRSLEEARFGGPSGTVLWDGRDGGGRPLPTGLYVIVLESVTAETATAERYRALVTLAGSH